MMPKEWYVRGYALLGGAIIITLILRVPFVTGFVTCLSIGMLGILHLEGWWPRD